MEPAGPELRDILHNSIGYLTEELHRELYEKAPTDQNEFTHAVELWIERLKVIKYGLESFPIPLALPATTASASSLRISSLEYRNCLNGENTLVPQAYPSPAAITACLERDQQQCIITGRRSTDGFNLEVVHIIPFSLVSHQRCRSLDFWKMVEMFYGSEATDNIFGGLVDQIDNLENLITIDSSIRAMLDGGKLTLTPGSSQDNWIPVINDHRGDYWLSIGYLKLKGPMGPQDFIYSSKDLPIGDIRRLLHSSRVDMAYDKAIGSHTIAPPQPSYFALHAVLHYLKWICERNRSERDRPIPTGAAFISSPVTTLDVENQYQTYHSASDSSSSPDPVLGDRHPSGPG